MYVPNPDFEDELREEGGITPALAAAANVAKARTTPVEMMPRGGSEPIEVQVDGDEVALVNTDYGAHLAEWGSINNPPFAPLRRGIRAAGLRLEEQ